MIVIDVKMPETCDFCPCVHKQDGGIYDEDYCQITHYAIEEGQHGRPEWCPLKESEEEDVKMGNWVDDKCSVCGKGIDDLISSNEWYRNEKPKFCPFCGAKIEIGRKKNDKEGKRKI